MPKSHIRETDVPGRFWSLLLLFWVEVGREGLYAIEAVQMLSTQKLAKAQNLQLLPRSFLNLMFGGRNEEVSHMHKNTLDGAINHISI